jgi:UDP-sugar diphosphatase
MAIDEVKIIKKEPLKEPKYIKPYRLIFQKDGKVRDWEVVQSHDSVAILLYHKDKDAFVLVRQFRAAVYIKNGDGYTVELCAGLVDKNKSLKEIAKDEILEECGYDVELKSIEKITSFYTAVGFAGGSQTLFFTQIDDSMKIDEGGGIDDEDIEVIYLPLTEARYFMFDEKIAKTPGLLYSFMWFSDKIKLF